MEIGRRIYYDKQTVNILIDTGERSGSVVPTTIEQDITSYTLLSERNRESFDVLELPFGAYREEFTTCTAYRVNPDTKKLEFSHTPADPEVPPVFDVPLTDQVAALKTENEDLKVKVEAQEIESAALKARDSSLQDDITFIYEIMGA